MEPELKKGKWLIMNLAGWSGPDRDEVNKAIKIAFAYQTKIQVGLECLNITVKSELGAPMLKQMAQAQYGYC